MRAVEVLWRFLVDLVVGDDPKVAVAVVSALTVTALTLASTPWSDGAVTVVGAVVVVGAFTAALAVDVRRSRS